MSDHPTPALPGPQPLHFHPLHGPYQKEENPTTVPSLADRLDSLDVTFASLRARLAALESLSAPGSASPSKLDAEADTVSPGVHGLSRKEAAEVEDVMRGFRQEIDELRSAGDDGLARLDRGVLRSQEERSTRRRPGTWDPSPTSSSSSSSPPSSASPPDPDVLELSELHIRQSCKLAQLRAALLENPSLPLSAPPTAPAHLLPFLHRTLLPQPTTAEGKPCSLARACSVGGAGSGSRLAGSMQGVLAEKRRVGGEIDGEGGGQAGIEGLGQAALEGMEEGLGDSDEDDEDSDSWESEL